MDFYLDSRHVVRNYGYKDSMADFIKNGRKLFLLIQAKTINCHYSFVKLYLPCLYHTNLENQLGLAGHPCHTIKIINMRILKNHKNK